MSDIPGEENQTQARMPMRPKQETMAGHTKDVNTKAVSAAQKMMNMGTRGMPMVAEGCTAATPPKKPDGLGKMAKMQTENRAPVQAPSATMVKSGPSDKTLSIQAPGKINNRND